MLWGIRPVEAQATHGIALDRLRAQIHGGLLLPGEKLPAERALAETFGISRVTLREALGALEAEGYITIRRGAHGGAFVADEAALHLMAQRRIARDPAAAMRIMEFRAANELAAARFAALRRTLPELKRLRAACAAYAAAATAPQAKQHNAAFLFALGDASHNPHLAAAITQGLGLMFEPFNAAWARRSAVLGALLDATERQDEAAAVAAMSAVHALDWESLHRHAAGGR
ncbi:MAG: GntR family transcriptional regulator [Rhizobiaceae bacterium]|jgi:DNA-binding FadR family transcriptional regulator|nr:GntR family transcriptional regulator [Rhizobiaceae bacterium]